MDDALNKFYIVFHGRFPAEKAAALFAAKSAEAFASLGEEVVLLVPRRFRRAKASAADYYKIEDNFRTVYLPTVDFYNFPLLKWLAFYVSFIFFSWQAVRYLARHAGIADIIYSNDSLPLWLASTRFPRVYYELHDYPNRKKWFYKSLFKRLKGIIVTNRYKKEKLVKDYSLSENKMFYEPNAVDLGEFDIAATKEESRKKLQLSVHKSLVVYTGHLYNWKGVDTLAQAAKFLPADTCVIFVGGTAKDLSVFRRKYGREKNIVLVGFRPHEEIPFWLRAADVLVVPNTAKEDISKYYTSPMKLFEYMASRRPIVASSIPSITEIIDDSNGYLVEPDNPQALAEKIKEVLADKEKSSAKAMAAYEKVKEHTWNERAGRVLKFING